MRALTKAGRTAFKKWVLNLSSDPGAAVPVSLLKDDAMSYSIPDSSDLSDLKFSTKYELAEELLPKVREIEGLGIDHDCWPGIWDSMALHYFQSVCPKNGDGKWNPNRNEHYVYTPDWKLRHRHRIYGPIVLFRNGGENVKPFFQKEPFVLGEYEEQVGSRQEIAGNSKALELLKFLYVKNGTTTLVSGYTSSIKYVGFKRKLPAPGSLRRFTPICNQLRRTYDLEGIDFNGFVDLLPSEFDDWKSA